MASLSSSQLSSRKKPKQLGKYCVAGGPGKASCKNNSQCSGISMHLFPKSNEKLRNIWIKFVQKHRPHWQASAYSALCSAHFESHCFTQRLDISLEMGNNAKTKRWLKKEAYPTVDTVIPSQTTREISDREQRQILRDTLKQDVPSSSTTTAIASDIATKKQLPDHTINARTPPDNKSKDLNVYKERLRKSKERNANLRKMLFQERSQRRKLLKSLEYDAKVEEGTSEGIHRTTKIATTKKDEVENVDQAQDYDTDEGSICSDQDLDWDVLEAGNDSEDDAEIPNAVPHSRNLISLPSDVKCQDEPKFIVFHSMLLSLFSLFCFTCKKEKPKVDMYKNGTMVTVVQHCDACGVESFKWKSQPYVFGRYPAGNLLLSFAILMAGASVSKILLVFKHMGLVVYTSRTFFYHQTNFVFPTILTHWESYQAKSNYYQHSMVWRWQV